MFTCVRSFRLPAALLIGALFTGLAGGCAKSPSSFKVPLEYRPSSNALTGGAFAGKMPPDGIYLEGVTDVRGRPEIGESRQKKATVKVYGSGQEPTKFVATILENKFMGAGARVVDTAKRAGRVVQTELTRFWTQQNGKAQATVEAVVTVKDRTGQALYQQTVTGTAESREDSLNPGTYQTLYSDAATRMVKNLMNDAEFRKSLGRNAQALAPKVAPKPQTEPDTDDTATADVSEDAESEQ